MKKEIVLSQGTLVPQTEEQQWRGVAALLQLSCGWDQLSIFYLTNSLFLIS